MGNRILTIADQYDWPLRFFSPDELKCKGTGLLYIPLEVGEMLDEVRNRFGRPLTVVSGYRSKKHNAAVGGALNSFHLHGRAFDLLTVGMTASDKAELLDDARAVGFGGHGLYPSFVHIDNGPRRIWL